MNKFFLPVILAVLLPVSCRNQPRPFVPPPVAPPVEAEPPRVFTVTDYMNKSAGGSIPEWVNRWLESGSRGVEALEEYADRYVFVYRNEGNNFAALNLWKEGFSPSLDFPRLAAARIEARFSSGVPFPDIEYGAFFGSLIRAASDASWRWGVKEDDFWIRRNFTQDGSGMQNENWEFLILVTMEKPLFVSQVDYIFRGINPDPPPSAEQSAAINRVKEYFFDGF